MSRLSRSCLALALAVLPGAALPHPHVFIDTEIELIFDPDGRLSAVRIAWYYDEFYSLMLVEENGLDANGDGTPDPDLLAGYAGKDVTWEAGFPGDFTLHRLGVELPLDRPEDHVARYDAGRIVTEHTRPLTVPATVTGGVVARAYDPTYFVAYDVPSLPTITGRDDCTVTRDAADRAEAQEKYAEDLAKVDQSGDPFAVVDLPDIGILFADAFEITCGPGS